MAGRRWRRGLVGVSCLAVQLRIVGLARGVRGGGVLLVEIKQSVGRGDEVEDTLLLL